MSKIDWRNIYKNELDAELCEGYFDGRNLESPEPSSNRHPAYIHGFRNGRNDAGITKKYETVQQLRNIWNLIVATCSQDDRAL